MSALPPRRPVARTHHGHTFEDPYEWLRDKGSPEVIRHLEAENAFTRAQTEQQAGTREAIYQEVVARVQQTDMSVPARRGAWWHFTRSVEGEDYRVHARVPVTSGDWTPPDIEPGRALEGEEALLDCNAEARGAEFFSLGAFSASRDGTRLVWAADTVGDELYTLRVRDLDSGEDLEDRIERTFAGAVIDPRGEHVYYATADEAWRPHRLWRHRVGSGAEADVLVLEERDESFWLGFDIARSERFLLIASQSKNTSHWWSLDLSDSAAEPVEVWPRVTGVEYSVEHCVREGEDRFLITHNRDRTDFSIVDVPAADPMAAGLPVAAELAAGARVEGVDAFADFAAVSYRSGGFARVGVLVPEAGGWSAVREVAALGGGREDAAEIGTTAVGQNPDWNQPHLRVSYESFAEPFSIVDVTAADGEARLRRRQPVLGDFDPTDYAQRLEWAQAADGTRIPVSIVWKPGALASASSWPAPTVLYGYGSYEASMDPYFSIARLSLLDRGVVWAVAHVRGGGEMGRTWYEQGRLEHKQNTFSDFVAAATHLIGAGITTPRRLVAMGGSAGGLLMGAVANQAPELFAGIVADVPFVDPLTSILMPELPLTVVEWDEWGDPLHDAEAYERIRRYSPYENVTEQAYPRILAVTSLNDTRVLYVEPAKWTARLREVGADVLLKTEMSAGHGGVSGRYAAWRDTAFQFAWILDVLGA